MSNDHRCVTYVRFGCYGEISPAITTSHASGVAPDGVAVRLL